MRNTIVCLKWGQGVYTSEWVNRLYRGTCRHISFPFHFVCFTDECVGLDPGIEARDINALTFAPQLNGIWWKLAVMHPDANLTGNCLFLDLDTVIVGSMEDFFNLPGRFCIIRNWIERRKLIFRSRPLIGNSSIFRFLGGSEPSPVEQFLKDPERATNRRIFRTEQEFMTATVGLDNITWWPDAWVLSYKRHCLPLFPLNWMLTPKIPIGKGARALTFHGRPKQDEVIRGYRGAPHKYSRPMPDLEKYWY